MTWRNSLLPASFRGVEFHVDASELEFGRRVQLHEFPLRDRPYAQDLGRRARMVAVEGYVIGADYMNRRNALVQALEAKGDGPLVHPYLGELRVSALTCRLGESAAEGGMARFQIEFAESGDAEFAVTPNTGAAVRATADAASEAAAGSFRARHSLAGRPQFVANAATSMLETALGRVQALSRQVQGAADRVAGLNRQVEAVLRDATTIVYAPATAAQAVASSVRSLLRNVTQSPRDVVAAARSFFSFGTLWPAIAPSTGSRRQQAVNQAEMVRLVVVTALSEAARASTTLQFDSFQEAIALRDELAEVMDSVMLDGADDATYDALRALRAAVVRDISARGGDLARLVAWTPRATMPALLAAQAIYADGSQAEELLLRNRIRHPLFLTGGRALEVLSA